MVSAEEKGKKQEQRYEKEKQQEQGQELDQRQRREQEKHHEPQNQSNQQQCSALRHFRTDGKTRWDYRIPVSEYHEMIDRAEETLRKIGQFFNNNLLDLPVEIQRTAELFHQPKFIHQLDFYLRYGVLNDFVTKHAECRKLLAFIFATRFPYLDPEATNFLGKVEGNPVPIPGTEPVFEDATTDERRTILMQQDHSSVGWIVDEKALESNIINDAVFRESMQMAVMAFDKWDIAGERVPVPPHNEGKYLSAEQLHYLERLIKFFDAGLISLGKQQQNEEAQQTHGESEAGPSGIRKRAQRLPPVPHETTVELEIDPMPPVQESDEMPETAKSDFKAIPYRPSDLPTENLKDTSDEGLTEYQGWMIESPPILLEKAKEFLGKDHHQDDQDWNRNYAELGEYLAYLLQTYDGEDWGVALREVVDMFRALAIFEDFHTNNPGLDPDDRTAFLRIGMSMSGAESRVDREFGRPVRPVISPNRTQIHAGITMDGVSVNDPPSKESRDPLSFTRWHRRLVLNQRYCGVQAAEETRQESRDLKREEDRDGDIMDIPFHWNGPVVGHLMDKEMFNTWRGERLFDVVRLYLERTAKRWPRPFMTELLRFVDFGRQGASHEDLDVKFHHAEYSAEPDKELLPFQAKDVYIFQFLSPRLLGAQLASDATPLQKQRFAVLYVRLSKILDSLVPSSLGDGGRHSFEWLMKELNMGCQGPVKRHRYSHEEVLDALPRFEEANWIRVQREEDAIFIERAPLKVYPEQLVRWQDPVPQQQTDSNEQEKTEEPSNAEAKQTTSTTPQQEMPKAFVLNNTNMNTALDSEEAEEHLKKTQNFFNCLAYRFGLKLRALQNARAADTQLLRDPMRRGANAASLQSVLQRYPANAAKKLTFTCRGGNVIKTYKDVVSAAEPAAIEPSWEEKSEEEVERLCKEIVRKRLLEEASENKTMLWPHSVPRDSQLVAPPGASFCIPPLQRREPLWRFAHPSNTGYYLPQRWNINRWPLQAQHPRR